MSAVIHILHIFALTCPTTCIHGSKAPCRFLPPSLKGNKILLCPWELFPFPWRKRYAFTLAEASPFPWPGPTVAKFYLYTPPPSNANLFQPDVRCSCRSMCTNTAVFLVKEIVIHLVLQIWYNVLYPKLFGEFMCLQPIGTHVTSLSVLRFFSLCNHNFLQNTSATD